MAKKKKFPMTKKFGGRIYKHSSTHNSRRTAEAEAKAQRRHRNARVVKLRQPERSKFKWGWHVYVASRKK